ncbi:MAG: hypothetical protein OXC57_00870 [Rhodobacteraceae bacterium]|nr:hypothetical protein [Paracoccaceae bacterium]
MRKTPPNGGPWAAPTPTDGPAPCQAMWSPSPVIGEGGQVEREENRTSANLSL